MNIYFKNQSDKKIILTLNGICYALPKMGDEIYSVDSNEVSLSLTTEDEYSFETFSQKRGMTLYHRFITVAHYNFIIEKDSEISLKTETAKGDRFESYQRVVASLKGDFLPEARYTVKNENLVKAKLTQDKKKLKEYENKMDKAGRVLNLGMKIDDIFADICLAVLAVIIIGVVIMAFIAFPIPTAVVVGILALICTLGWKFLKKAFALLTKILDRLFDKHGDKINDAITNCKNMPEGLYKDESSYFENEYISAVFKFSRERKQ